MTTDSNLQLRSGHRLILCAIEVQIVDPHCRHRTNHILISGHSLLKIRLVSWTSLQQRLESLEFRPEMTLAG